MRAVLLSYVWRNDWKFKCLCEIFILQQSTSVLEIRESKQHLETGTGANNQADILQGKLILMSRLSL